MYCFGRLLFKLLGVHSNLPGLQDSNIQGTFHTEPYHYFCAIQVVSLNDSYILNESKFSFFYIAQLVNLSGYGQLDK
jgi:hypothetical protein